MVGGVSFNVNNLMCCGVTGTGLMVRVGPEALGRFLAQPHVKPLTFAGKPLKGFVVVEPEGFRTDGLLAQWVQRGLDFVATLPSAPRRFAARPPRTPSRRPKRPARRS